MSNNNNNNFNNNNNDKKENNNNNTIAYITDSNYIIQTFTDLIIKTTTQNKQLSYYWPDFKTLK